MYEQIISARDEGQRIDKYLQKLLPAAGTSFLYKMMRKKNITLNDKRAQGMEKLTQGDSVKIYFSEATLEKFMGKAGSDTSDPKKERMPVQAAAAVQNHISERRVIFENEHVLFVNKPAGVLSQKAKPDDYSVNEWIVDYLRAQEQLSDSQLLAFRPCVCNRLDRNTSGLVLCAKSVRGAQFLSDALKQRTMEKYYLALVKGQVMENSHLTGYLVKDESANKVTVSRNPLQDGVLIETSYGVLHAQAEHSLLKVHLITGKPHQIRAHLASIGHPVIGDDKYGDRRVNRIYREKYGIANQMLHAWQVCFPEGCESLGVEQNKIYTADVPPVFRDFLSFQLPIK